MKQQEQEEIFCELVIEQKFRVYYIKCLDNKKMYELVVNSLVNELISFSYGLHHGVDLLSNAKLEDFVEAARSVYTIDSEDEIETVGKRGELGELILHKLLRTFLKTTPLISKIFFKDSRNSVVHGFDAVHVGKSIFNKEQEELYLGESKFYSNGKQSINELIKDIKQHMTIDFLKDEFALIGKKAKNIILSPDASSEVNVKAINDWQNKFVELHKDNKKICSLFSSITITAFSAYETNLKLADSESAFKKENEKNYEILHEGFKNKLLEIPQDTIVPINNIVLMLFPFPSKAELYKAFNKKLLDMQKGIF